MNLPEDALSFAPSGSCLTIGKLVMHLAGSDVRWTERIRGRELPASIRKDLENMSYDEMRETHMTSLPALRDIPDMGALRHR